MAKIYDFNEILTGKPYEDNPGAKDACETFHESRIMFAFPDKKLAVMTNDNRDHVRWLHEDYGITEEQFEQIDRGYLRKEPETGRIMCLVYKGINHASTNVTNGMVEELKELAAKYWKDTVLRVWTGCKVGKPGEIWEPISFVTDVRL